MFLHVYFHKKEDEIDIDLFMWEKRIHFKKVMTFRFVMFTKTLRNILLKLTKHYEVCIDKYWLHILICHSKFREKKLQLAFLLGNLDSYMFYFDIFFRIKPKLEKGMHQKYSHSFCSSYHWCEFIYIHVLPLNLIIKVGQLILKWNRL